MLIIAFELYMVIVQAMWYELQTCSCANQQDKESYLDAKVTNKVQKSHNSYGVINQSETKQVHDLEKQKNSIESTYHVRCLGLKLERGTLDNR